MTDKQPEALRLAHGLEGDYSISYQPYAAAELRRLHAAHEHQYAMAGLMLREAERTRRELDELREAARMALNVLDDAGSRLCEVAHHNRADRHDFGAPCPVERRRDEAMKALREALRGEE